MPPELKLLQLNIEQDKHLDKIVPFLEKFQPDVVSMQEIPKSALPGINEALKSESIFAPMTMRIVKCAPQLEGVAIFSRFPIKAEKVEYYFGNENSIRKYDRSTAKTKHDTQSYCLLSCDIEKGGKIFKFATTHFTWTPDGEPDEFQRKDMKNLLEILKKHVDIILAGDFNAPRGGEMFGKLKEIFRDNVPEKYTTSLDKKLHRAGPDIEKMVDGIFTRGNYKAADVEMVSGLSDHCALTAKIDIGRES